MHHIYTTPGFIIHSTPHGEAGKFLLIFTKDFGMIGATAQGIRLAQSKLRYHIQDFSFSTVSVVRGKEMWRITGAHESENRVKPARVHLKILKLLRRLLHGEEKNEKLFEIIEELYKTEIKEEDADAVECLTVLRVLNSLGYISTKDFGEFFDTHLITSDLIAQIKIKKPTLIQVINSALNETQL